MKILNAVTVELFNSKNVEEPVDCLYLKEHAAFVHRNAAEFMFYIGGDNPETNRESFCKKISNMRTSGCSKRLIDSCHAAWEVGAVWVLFYY